MTDIAVNTSDPNGVTPTDPNHGLLVTKPGVNQGTAGRFDYLINSIDPMIKLDATKSISFQNISLTFLSDPPEPPGIAELSTVVYSFDSTYGYVTRMWALAQVVTAPTAAPAFYQQYFQTIGVISSNTAFDYAALQIETAPYDGAKMPIELRIRKYKDTASGGLANNLAGCKILVRVYVFVDGLGTE